MVRNPDSGKYRRTRLFALTLGCSWKCVRLLAFRSNARVWAELHEQAYRRLGGSPRVVVLDDLRDGVLCPDFYDPGLNPLLACAQKLPKDDFKKRSTCDRSHWFRDVLQP